jgi:RNA polymerase sigma factor (sigma-70 family)
LKIWEKRADLTGLISFPAWLHVLTRNYLINNLQKKIPANFQDGLSKQELPENRLLPEEQLDLKEMSILIQQAVNALSPRQQQVYRLSREDGLTLNQIASQLGISYDTIREHMNNALRNIRFYLKEHYGEMGLLIWLLIQL